MARYSRPQAAYPGEWAFILGSKLVSAIPAHDRRREIKQAPGYETLAIHSTTPGPSATSMIPTLPTPTGESDDESSDSESSSDGESSAGDDDEEDNDSDSDSDSDSDDNGDDDNGSTLDGDKSIGEEPISVPTLSYSPRALPQLEHLKHLRARGNIVGRENEPDASTIEAGVIGTLLLILILLGLCLFRRQISRNRCIRASAVGSRGVEPKSSISERVGSIFGSKSNTLHGEKTCDPPLPPPAITRYSSTSSLRNSQPPTWEDCGAEASPSLDRRNSSSHEFPRRPASQDMSNRSPVSVQTPAISSISSTPSLADGFFYALSELKQPIQAPRPIVIIPAFLVPESPMEPQRSHFSWSTNGTSQAPSTPSVLTAQRISITESELRCSWMSRNNRGTTDIPSVTITTRESQSGPPPTPAGFQQHPPRVEVGLGIGGRRIKSAEFDKKIHWSCEASRASNATFGPEHEEFMGTV